MLVTMGPSSNIFGQDSADDNFGGDIVMRAGRVKLRVFRTEQFD